MPDTNLSRPTAKRAPASRGQPKSADQLALIDLACQRMAWCSRLSSRDARALPVVIFSGTVSSAQVPMRRHRGLRQRARRDAPDSPARAALVSRQLQPPREPAHRAGRAGSYRAGRRSPAPSRSTSGRAPRDPHDEPARPGIEVLLVRLPTPGETPTARPARPQGRVYVHPTVS
jgi:hypothetical protein